MSTRTPHFRAVAIAAHAAAIVAERPHQEHTMTSATDIASLLLSQDIGMDDDGQRDRTPEQAIDGWRDAAAAAGDLDLVEQIDEVGADAVAAEYRRLAEERVAAGRRIPGWLVL